MDSSFLDPRLQSALNQSQLVQSQLRLTVFKPQETPQNHKQRGKMRRSNTVERGVERGNTLVFGRLLLETSIKHTVKSFMGRDLEKIVDMLTIKILRMRPIVPKSSISHLDPLDSAIPINKENVLYAASTAKHEEQLPVVHDLQDLDKLRHEVAELRQVWQKHTKDFLKCKNFYYHIRSSEHCLYYYYMQRLYHARKAYEASKVRLVSGAYLSAMFDLKCHEMKGVEEGGEGVGVGNSILHTIGFNLANEVGGIIENLIEIDQDTMRQVEEDIQRKFEEDLAKERELHAIKLKALDERLYKILQTVRYVSNVTTATLPPLKLQPESKNEGKGDGSTKDGEANSGGGRAYRGVGGAMKVSGQEDKKNSEGVDFNPHTPINYEDLYNKEAAYMRTFLRGVAKDVSGCMERCMEMINKRNESQKITLEYLRNMKSPASSGPWKTLDSEVDFEAKEDRRLGIIKEGVANVMEGWKEEMSRQEKDILSHAEREKIFSQHAERLQAMRESVQQRRGALINQIKGRMNTLYTATQSRSKRHSFVFTSYPS